MSRLAGKRVLLGVGGGIAAYKTPDLVRALRKVGAEVRVVVTPAACEFVSANVLEVLSENRVGRALFDPAFEHEIGHIALARWPDVVLIAPATANLIARARAGMADDLLTTLLLATTAPVVWCPAMNTQMLAHPATQENMATIAARARQHVVRPDDGDLACGEVGAGRLPDPPVLLAAAERALPGGTLAGRRVVVTAGPTREWFDPVRFLSNPSTGKMGFALAAACHAQGADVRLIAGPTALATPPGVARVDVASAAEMLAAVRATAADVLIKTAAVADWTPVEVATQKRKKGDGAWSPALTRTVDILSSVTSSEDRPAIVVGFAAETERVVEYATDKLHRKGLDAIVANDVGPGGAFGSDHNQVTVLTHDGRAIALGPADKRSIADGIVQAIAELTPRAAAAGQHAP